MNVKPRHVRANIVAVEKQSVLHILRVSVALGTQREMRMRRIVTMACPALLHFSTLSHKRHDFGQNFTEQKMCVLIFSTTFV